MVTLHLDSVVGLQVASTNKPSQWLKFDWLASQLSQLLTVFDVGSVRLSSPRGSTVSSHSICVKLHLALRCKVCLPWVSECPVASTDQAAQATSGCRSEIVASDREAAGLLREKPRPLPAPRPQGPFGLQLRVLSTRIMRKLYR